MNKFNDLIFKNFFKLLTASIIVISFIHILSPFLIPFIFGGMLALALSPFISYFMLQKKFSRKKSIAILSFGILLLGLIPSTLFIFRGAKILTQFFSQQSFSALTLNAQIKMYAIIDRFAEINNLDPEMIRTKFDAVLGTVAAFTLKTFSDLMSQIPDLLLASIVTMLSFYFFLLKEEYIRNLFDRYFYFAQDNANHFIHVLKSSCREVFFSNVLTGILQSLIVSIGALACGIGDFYITFVVTFVLSFIPVVGAAPMAFIIALLAFSDGRVGAGITMGIIGVFTGLVDNVIRPYLASLGEVEVPAFIGFLAVIGGIVTFGLPGLFVGPLLASMMFGIIPIIFEEYFPKEHEEDGNKAKVL